MKYVFICDNCGKMEPHNEGTVVECPGCGNRLRQTNMTMTFWEKQSDNVKSKIIEEYNIGLGKSLLEYGTYVNTQSLGNVWLLITKVVILIFLFLAVVASVVFGIYFMTLTDVPAHILIGLLIIVGGIFSAVISVSATMAVLTMFEDVDEIKHYLAQKFDINFYKE